MFVIGTILMLLTIFGVRYNIWGMLLINIVALTSCIAYQIKRSIFKYQTIGELIIGNDNKAEVLLQNKKFSITRVPLFILLIITLIINSNLINGLTTGVKFGIGDVLYNTLVLFCLYYGLKNFFLKPDWLPLILICGGVFLAGFIFKTKQVTLLYDIYYILGIIWLFIGILYKLKSVYSPNTP